MESNQNVDSKVSWYSCIANTIGSVTVPKDDFNSIMNLIESQKQELDRLYQESDRLSQCILHHPGLTADALKDFSDALKSKAHNYYPSVDSYCVSRKVVLVSDIDDTLKEYVEVSDESIRII